MINNIDEKVLIRLQANITAKLNSEEYFSTISVKSLRKMHTAKKEIDREYPHLTAKGGKRGAGVLVGYPMLLGKQPNLPGPQGDILLPIDVMEQCEINQVAASGTLKTAEEIALVVRGVVHQFQMAGLTSVYQDEEAISPIEPSALPAPGMVGHRVLMRGKLPAGAPSKVLVPTLAINGATVTITNATSGATIYYSLSPDVFPGAGDAAATLYAGPFEVETGDVIYFAAYKTGMFGSDVGKAVVS